MEQIDRGESTQTFDHIWRGDDLLDRAMDATVARLKAKTGLTTVSNLDLSKVDDLQASIILKTAPQNKINDAAPVIVHAVYLECKETERVDRTTAEVTDLIRSTILDADGQVWATGSPVVAEVTLALLESKLCRKRFDPPLKMIFNKVPIGPSQSYLTCTIDPQEIQRLFGTRS